MNAITPISSSPNFDSSSNLQKLEQQKQTIQASIEQVKKNDLLDEETKQKKLKELQQKLAAIEQTIQQAKQKTKQPTNEEATSKTALSPKGNDDLKQNDKLHSPQKEFADEYISSSNQPRTSARTYHLSYNENGQPIISFDKSQKYFSTRTHLENTKEEEEKNKDKF